MVTQQLRQAGRFARPGATGSSSGRVSRTAGRIRPSGRPSRPAPSSLGLPSVRRRRTASAPRKALTAVAGLLPGGGAAKKGATAGKKPLGLAALAAGAVGFAFSRREKLRSTFRGARDEHDAGTTAGADDDVYSASPVAPAVAPATPSATPGL